MLRLFSRVTRHLGLVRIYAARIGWISALKLHFYDVVSRRGASISSSDGMQRGASGGPGKNWEIPCPRRRSVYSAIPWRMLLPFRAATMPTTMRKHDCPLQTLEGARIFR